MGPLYCWKKTLSSSANHRSCPQKPVCCTRLDSLAIHIQDKTNPGPDFSANHPNYFCSRKHKTKPPNIRGKVPSNRCDFIGVSMGQQHLVWDCNSFLCIAALLSVLPSVLSQPHWDGLCFPSCKYITSCKRAHPSQASCQKHFRISALSLDIAIVPDAM